MRCVQSWAGCSIHCSLSFRAPSRRARARRGRLAMTRTAALKWCAVSAASRCPVAGGQECGTWSHLPLVMEGVRADVLENESRPARRADPFFGNSLQSLVQLNFSRPCRYACVADTTRLLAAANECKSGKSDSPSSQMSCNRRIQPDRTAKICASRSRTLGCPKPGIC